jgi:hypothetical protein
MTELLTRAFKKAAKEMSDREQDEFGRWLIAMIESGERDWDAAFARTQDKLEILADRALEAFRRGLAEPLDPKKL